MTAAQLASDIIDRLIATSFMHRSQAPSAKPLLAHYLATRHEATLGLTLDSEETDEDRQDALEHAWQRADEFESFIQQAHTILDGMGVPSAKGATCTHDDCNSQLVHRLKTLAEQTR